jgi:hypothetical protein
MASECNETPEACIAGEGMRARGAEACGTCVHAQRRTTPLRSPYRTIVLFGLYASALPALGTAAPVARGLWPMPRRDAANWARCDVPGNMRHAPREVWHYGGLSDAFAYLVPVRLGGRDLYFGQVRAGLRLVRPDGRIVWKRPGIGVGSVVEVGDFGGATRALVTTGADGFAMVDIANGRTLWQWSTPHGSFLNAYRVHHEGKKARLFVFPQNSLIGFSFDLATKSGVPALLWQHEYRDAYWVNFGPSFVLKDMDRDERPEIVLAGKPGYMAVIDADTGAVKCDIRYDVPGADHFGRPYGLLDATDIDGDGYPDVVMASCQVEEYIAVVHNEGGKKLRLLWSRFIEQDFPQDVRELRPNVTSMVDLHGDRRKEMVVGLFNLTGDGRWHTVVIDPMRGFDARLADLPDRYFWGCYDLAGDGRPMILTSTETKRLTAPTSTIQAVDGRTFRDAMTIENACFATYPLKLPRSVAFMANRSTPMWLSKPGAPGGVAIRRGSATAAEELWRIRGGTSTFEPLTISATSRLAMFSEATGMIGRTDLALRTPPVDVTPHAGSPLVTLADGKRELVLALSNGTVIGGEPDLAHPGRFRRSWTVPGSQPACWLGPRSERVVCTIVPEGIAINRPVASAACAACKPDVVIRTPSPVMSRGVALACSGLLPFGTEKLLVYAGMQTGVHTMAGALYAAAGKQLWFVPEDGPYPRSPAVADLRGDGHFTIIVDDHGRHTLYDEQGRGRMVAHGWYDTIPGRGDGGKYVLPIVGPFGPRGEIRMVMSSGLQAVETLDATGARLAKWDTKEIYELEWSSSSVGVARCRLGHRNGRPRRRAALPRQRDVQGALAVAGWTEVDYACIGCRGRCGRRWSR